MPADAVTGARPATAAAGASADWDAISARVQEIAQAINQQWDSVREEAR